MPTQRKVLLIDDHDSVRWAIRDFLTTHGFTVIEAENGRQAEDRFRASRPDIVIADYRLPDCTALELMPRLHAIEKSAPVVILTGHGTVDLAVTAIQQGAQHFLTKPVDLKALLIIIQRIVDGERLRNREKAERSVAARRAIDPFFGASRAIAELRELAETVAGSDANALILGETGAGKGELAKWIHAHSARAGEAFVDINCAGLSRELLESELFGYERGAFTGAMNAKPGLLEVAHRGTVFLDEIGDIELQVQPKLLKVLEDHRVRRLGAVKDKVVDVRLLSATHQNLAALDAEKRFRPDLLYRINTITLAVPALRQRREDIPLLVESMLSALAADVGRTEVRCSPDAMRRLQSHAWPGNLRELRNTLERALLTSKSGELGPGAFSFSEAADQSDTGTATMTLDEVEQLHIERALRHHEGHVERAAQTLGISRASLYEKIRRYNLSTSRKTAH